jgi:hypothetical protein
MSASVEAILPSRNALPVCLWKENLHRLVSWQEMQFFVTKAMRAMELLRSLEMELLFEHPPIPSPTFHEACACKFDELRGALGQLGLTRQAIRAGELGAFIRAHDRAPDQKFLSDLALLIHHDLEGFVFEAIPIHRVEFYEQQSLFGAEVHASFPSASFDIREAGNCYALGRWTASVFHLMRALEPGLTTLGALFGVTLSHTTWGPFIEQIESKIREMPKDPIWKAAPDWKEQQEFYAQAASHLGIVKDAWRNCTAHARGKYDEKEASDVMTGVRAFMEKLATRLHE